MATLTDRIAARKDRGATCAVCGGIIERDGSLWYHMDGVSRVHGAEPHTFPRRSTESPYMRRAHAGTLTPSARTLATEE